MSGKENTSASGKAIETKVKTLVYVVEPFEFMDMLMSNVNNDETGEDLLLAVTARWDGEQAEARPPYPATIKEMTGKDARGKKTYIKKDVIIHEVAPVMTWSRLVSKIQYYNKTWKLDLPRMTFGEHSMKETADLLKEMYQKKLQAAAKKAKARRS